jgi:hypothetical protein
MIIVQDTFVCKPGNAGKIAKLFKEMMEGQKYFSHVMTDMTGQYHRVIMVSQYQDLAEYQRSWEEYGKDTERQKREKEQMGNMNDMYVSGSREIYKAW